MILFFRGVFECSVLFLSRSSWGGEAFAITHNQISIALAFVLEGKRNEVVWWTGGKMKGECCCIVAARARVFFFFLLGTSSLNAGRKKHTWESETKSSEPDSGEQNKLSPCLSVYLALRMPLFHSLFLCVFLVHTSWLETQREHQLL